VGDEAFPLKTYLMRPYPGSQRKGDNEKSIFNYRLSRARRVVENAFGILSQKFQIYQRTLRSLPENAGNIIFASCILHNYLGVQGVGLVIWEVLQMFEAILQKYQTKQKVPSKVLLK
jgi:hypothetical protein